MSRVRSTASFERVEEKREEMAFFLDQLAGSADNPFVFRCYFSAFASAAMSVLYALEAARRTIGPDFAAWYEPRRLSVVEGDPVTSYVLDRRGESVHVGETRVREGRASHGSDGMPVYEHFFALVLGQRESITVDVLSACRHTDEKISALVSEVPEAFPAYAPTTSWTWKPWSGRA